ncbi:hypothetical protein OUZ56_000010 [Daphnia magna]|uniref:Uncharacterized protein n=1 Tax=Daphnia magna TaxID=35525 RepID=A0ABQ9ZZ89_9CRUS|nr:hypothetical protein OUZ56_000010 [Daphnia magna]
MPYAMQLLGGFNKNPVPPADIEKAKVVLINFITEHKRLGYPDSSIIVCQDVVECPEGSKDYVIIGRKFLCKRDAFLVPYRSSDYDSYVVSKLCKDADEWDFNLIKVPNKFNPFHNAGNIPSTLPDILQTNSNQQCYRANDLTKKRRKPTWDNTDFCYGVVLGCTEAEAGC